MSPDISLPAGVWSNVYTASGITPGTPILVINKGGSMAFLWEGPTPPANSAWDGATFFADPWVADQVGITGCWVKSNGPVVINVQVYTL